MAGLRGPDELAVLAAISTFTSAIKDNAVPTLTASVHPSGTTARVGGPSLQVFPLPELVKYMANARSQAPVEAHWPSDTAIVKVADNGKLAMAWVAWESWTDGVVSHKGDMVFVLAKDAENKWVIVSNADSMVAVEKPSDP